MDSILRFDRSSDAYVTLPTSPDYTFVAGEGYRIVVNDEIDDTGNNNDFEYEVDGSHTDSTITFYGPSDTVPEGGTSASGTNFYCPPYHASSKSASAFKAELGASFTSISKLDIDDDGLSTYAGISTNNDFDLVPGEAYVVKVSTGANLTPSTTDASIEDDVTFAVHEHMPGCGYPDGGHIRVFNNGPDFDIKVSWDGNTSDGAKDNYVFLPKKSNGASEPTSCTDGSCKIITCPPPVDDPPDTDTCDFIDDCDTCGCELDGAVGLVIESGKDFSDGCANVGCGDRGCDNDTTFPSDCLDESKVFCNALVTSNGISYTVDEIRYKGGGSWETVNEVPTYSLLNCCQFECLITNVPCDVNGDCTGGAGDLCRTPSSCIQ